MATDVLSARDYLVHYQGHRNDHFRDMIYPHEKVHHYGKKSPQHPQSKKKSGHGCGSSPQKAKIKGENPEKKRPLKTKPHEEYQLEILKWGVVNSIVKGSNCNFGYGDEHIWRKEALLERGKEPAKNLVLMGQVTILKRGQALKPDNNHSSQLEIVKKKTTFLVVSPTETLGPDPTLVPKNGTLASRSVSSKGSKAAALSSVQNMLGLKPERAKRGNGTKTLNFPVTIVQKWAGPAYTNSSPPSCLPLPRFSTKFVKESADIDRFTTRDLRRMVGLD